MQKYYFNDQDSTSSIVGVLKQGKIAICSTDTVLGLLADLSLKSATLLSEIKGRTNKPCLILVESAAKAEIFVDPKKLLQVENIMKNCWPGPLTIIFNAKRNVPSYIKSAQGTVALRVPKHEGLLELLAHFDGLFSTSANLTGKPVPDTFAQISPELLEKVDFLIANRNEQEGSHLPSTILDCTQDRFKIVREGAFSRATLEKIYGATL